MNRETIYSLIQKHQQGIATDAEKQALANWYSSVSSQDSEFPEEEDDVHEEILMRLLDEIDFQKKRSVNYKGWAVAASLLIMLTAGTILFFNKYKTAQNQTIAQEHPIRPGGNKAILVLANGSKVLLTDVATGKIAQQSGSQITKTADGKLVYSANPNAVKNTLPQYNTMQTPKGGQYQLLLSDGTRVWLNAESSIKYPVSFDSFNERRVELTGEAYFEVAHNKALPFRVVSNKQVIEVLGTHFNVNAYPDEQNTTTTLLEGAVKIIAGDKNATLKPGQEADLTTTFKISTVDPREAIDWKNGNFRFNEEPLESVMRQIARWYDVKIVYEDESVKKETIVAVTTRFANLSALLKIMEQITNDRFIISGSTIRVAKK
ncbi:FecR family protein [Mucilaginibacter sp. SG564]|uniref:FecR family protein n=1 Tax=unclassified Mucilaginibacter TaxID=2617802 RepID=UPI0015534D39|nr:FecR family protein [Mucilaginibacter sp. SG564]NOW93626.1 ferric-dicitrate binding protein FerR (iron transport regulator) [Mucilaginibacter sp. SG564]